MKASVGEHCIKTAERFGILERCRAFERDLLKIKDIVPDAPDDGVPFDLDGFLSGIFQVIIAPKYDIRADRDDYWEARHQLRESVTALPGLNVRHRPLPGRPVKIAARPSVIRTMDTVSIPVVCGVALQVFFLIDDRIAVPGQVIVTRKPLVQSRNLLFTQYEEEQKQVRQVIGELQSLIDDGEQEVYDLRQFLKSVRKYTTRKN